MSHVFLHPVLLLGSNGANNQIEWNWKHLLEEFRKFGYEHFFLLRSPMLSYVFLSIVFVFVRCSCCYCCSVALTAADRLHTSTTIRPRLQFIYAGIHRIVDMKRGGDLQHERMENEIFPWCFFLLRFVMNFFGNICAPVLYLFFCVRYMLQNGFDWLEYIIKKIRCRDHCTHRPYINFKDVQMKIIQVWSENEASVVVLSGQVKSGADRSVPVNEECEQGRSIN